MFFQGKAKYVIAVIAGVLIWFSGSTPTWAAKDEPPAGAPERAITESLKVSPTKFETNIRPGHETSITLEVHNNSREEMVLTLKAWNFARDDQGAIHEISDADAQRFRGAAKWLEYSNKPLTIGPGEKAKVPVTIKAPEGAEPGTHVTYLRVLGVPKNTEGKTVVVRYAIDALFLPIVIGETHGQLPVLKTDVELANFSAGQSIYADVPFDIVAKVRNGGNIHQNFDGTIEIWQGKTKLRSFPLKQTLLPSQTSALIANVEGIPYLGRFRAKFTGSAFLAKSHKQQKLSGSFSFWYIPIALFYAVAALATIVLLILIWLVRRRRQALASEDGR